MTEDLTRLALVGTARHPGTVGVRPGDAGDASNLGHALVGALATSDPESTVLLRAAVQAVIARAGHMAEANVDPVEAAAPECMRTPGIRLRDLLQRVIGPESKDLFAEMLSQLLAANVHLPHDFLPDALDVKDVGLRERLLPVLGERGRWLSRFNPSWAWVLEGIETPSDCDHDRLERVWDEGAPSERCRALEAWRRSDPAAARAKLAATLAKESAEHRARFVGVLATGLSAEDEAFLEQCLDDRSSNVRLAAADLLSQLLGSAFSQRMRARANALLAIESHGLVFKSLTIRCTPPEAIDKDWERDGVMPKPPGGLGKRAFWTETILQRVPLSHWQFPKGARPDALLKAAREDQYGESILLGWSQACVRFAAADSVSAAWVSPLWSAWDAASRRAEGANRQAMIAAMKALVGVMSRAEAETNVFEVLSENLGTSDASEVALLECVPRPWSADFAARYRQLTQSVLQKTSDQFAFQWLNTLSLAARACPPESFEAALAPWEPTPPETRSSWVTSAAERELERFRDTLLLRQSFYREISA